jgi:hypothetical protein
VSVGLKTDADGFSTHEMCFRVYYDKKLVTGTPMEQLVPPQIENIPTQVIDVNTSVSPSAKIDKYKYRPMFGGSYIKSANSFAHGTLGCFVTDDESDDVFLLSNYHILMINGEESGHQVAQPGFCCEAWPCRCGEVAKIERGAFVSSDPAEDKNVDCAVASLSNGQENYWTNKIIALGYIAGIPVNDVTKEPLDPRTNTPTDADTGKAYLPLLPGETVYKRGIASKRTEGIVIDITAPALVGYTTREGTTFHLFKKQILVAPKKEKKPFTRKGDSGAVIVNHLNQVVGLHIADNERRREDGKVAKRATVSIANPIQDVLKALKISIPNTGTLQTLLLRETDEAPAIPKRHVFDDMATLVQQHADGPALVDAFTAFRHEVMQLINHNREVKVAWHRCQGPLFVAHLAERGKNPGHQVPVEINGTSFQRLLSKMSVVLEKNGSPALAKTVEQYTINIIGIARSLFQSFNHTKS